MGLYSKEISEFEKTENKKLEKSWAVVMHALNPSTQEADLCEFAGSLAYRVISRIARSVKKRNPVSNPTSHPQKIRIEKFNKQNTETLTREKLSQFSFDTGPGGEHVSCLV